MGKSFRACCVRGCGNTETLNLNLKFHYFPRSIERCEQWVRAASNDKLAALPVANICKSGFRICSQHFSSKQYRPSGIKLAEKAIPDLHLPDSSTVFSSELFQNPLETTSFPSTSKGVVSSIPLISSLGVLSSTLPTSIDHIPSSSQYYSSESPLSAQWPVGTSTPLTESNDSVSSLSTSSQHRKRSIDQSKISRKRRCLLKELNLHQSDVTPRKKKMLTALQKSCRSLKRIKDKSYKLRQLMKDRKALVANFIMEEFPPLRALLFTSQLRYHPNPKGRRWTREEKALSLSLYKKSPCAYAYFRTFCDLPCKRTLTTLLNTVSFPPGCNSPILSNLSTHIQNLKEVSKYCSLVFDEMAIKPSLQYNRKVDRIDGFEDDGHMRSSKVAKQVLVFSIQGIFDRWKQPLSYYLSESGMSGVNMSEIIKDLIHKLKRIGLTVCATICDMGTNNVKAVHLLGSSYNKPYFIFEGRKVFTFFDPPHLLKCFRNLFLKYNVLVNVEVAGEQIEMEAKFEHIEQVKKLDESISIRKLLSLTNKHLQPTGKDKMKVKYAAEIFSSTLVATISTYVAHGYLPDEAIATASFLADMDDLFDSFNASGRTSKVEKPLRRSVVVGSPHAALWQNMLCRVQGYQFIKTDGKKVNPPSKSGWLDSIRAVLMLFDEFKSVVPVMETRNLNQDPLENLFGQIRYNCGSNVHPNYQQFLGSFKTVLINGISKEVTKGNCEADNLSLLSDFNWLCDSSEEVEDGLLSLPSLALEVEPDNMESIHLQSPAHLSNHFLKNICHQTCHNCKNDLTNDHPPMTAILIDFKGEGGSIYPSENLIASVAKSMALLNSFILQVQTNDKLCETMTATLLSSIDFTFITCQVHGPNIIKKLTNMLGLVATKDFCTRQNKYLCI